MIYNDNGKVEEGEAITSTSIWIRSVIDKDCVNQYFFSTDGIFINLLAENIP